MKSVLALVIASLVSTASCGRLESASQTDSAVARTSYTFSRDLRIADGSLTLVHFEQNSDNTWTVNLSQKSISGKTTNEILGEEMNCKVVSINAGSAVYSMDCKRDLRPVDGSLNEIIVKRNVDSTYDVSQVTKYFDRINGKEVTSTKLIAGGLKTTLPSKSVVH